MVLSVFLSHLMFTYTWCILVLKGMSRQKHREMVISHQYRDISQHALQDSNIYKQINTQPYRHTNCWCMSVWVAIKMASDFEYLRRWALTMDSIQLMVLGDSGHQTTIKSAGAGMVDQPLGFMPVREHKSFYFMHNFTSHYGRTSAIVDECIAWWESPSATVGRFIHSVQFQDYMWCHQW